MNKQLISKLTLTLSLIFLITLTSNAQRRINIKNGLKVTMPSK